jgi:protein-disulfide isomerase
MMTRLISAMAAVAVLALGGFLMMPRAGETPVNPLVGAANAQHSTADVDISSVKEMTLGDENAPVTIVEYASYTCPHCADFHEGPLKKLKADFIDTGKVKFIYREAYFDRYGLWASMVARCEPSKFFGITDMIFETQSDWLRAGDANAVVGELRKMGRVAGLTEDQLNACLTDAQNAQTLVAWYQDHFERDGITGTPSFMINGTKVENQSYDGLKKIIEAELAKQ